VAVKAIGGKVVKKLPVRAVDLDEEYSMEGRTARTQKERKYKEAKRKGTR
jgi:hypothetical protein